VVQGEGKGASSPWSDARADVWSWGVLLHALLTRSTAVAKGESVSAYVTMMEGEAWWDVAAALWGAGELPRGVFHALKHSLCTRESRVGLLAGAVLLGQQGAVEEMVHGTDAPDEVKKAELRIASLESHMVDTPDVLPPPSSFSAADVLTDLADAHEVLGDEAQAMACLQLAARLFPNQADDIKRARVLSRLADALDRRGDFEEAAALFEQALRMQRRLLPEDHKDTATSLNNLAICHESMDEYGKAVPLHEEALAMRRRLLPEDHMDIAASLSNLANCHAGHEM
jgi:tetratricopeptide (TPR) repeat protein